MSEITEVGRLWTERLEIDGYEAAKVSPADIRRLRRYSRAWRRLHKLVKTTPHTTFFEFGCGGGGQLVPLALNGHRVEGIDVSHTVLGRASEYIQNVERVVGRKLPISLHWGDFLNFAPNGKEFDVVFNFGVIEHFLDDEERLKAVNKMLALTVPGGYAISVVPSGMHPLRQRMRDERLFGYDVPEIDYTAETARREMLEAGASDAFVYPHNLFGYLLWEGKGINKYLRRSAHALAQMLPAEPSAWAFARATTVIIVGRNSGH